MINNFLDLYIPERYAKIIEDPDPHYIHQILAKHLYIPVALSKKRFNVSINNKVTFEIIISGSYEDIYELYAHIEPYGVQFHSTTQTSLIVEIGDFLRKIY
jgi:hypothetical protein